MQIIYMYQYLPYSGFKWLKQKEIDKFCFNSVKENSLIGYILELILIVMMSYMNCIMIIH